MFEASAVIELQFFSKGDVWKIENVNDDGKK